MPFKFQKIIHKAGDKSQDLWTQVSDKPPRCSLCHECERIPFNEYLPSVARLSEPRPTPLGNNSNVFCLKLDNVLSHRAWCKFCGLLFKSMCRPEYDLLKDEHIAKHLHTSDKLKDVETFKQWIEKFSSWERWTEGEDIWPFGYTRDQKEAAKQAENIAMELFQSAEDKDLNAGVLNGAYEAEDNLDKALKLGAFAAGIGGIASPRREFAGAQLVMSQMAMFSMGKAKPLPCLLIVRAYQLGETKDGVLSVRVFAHGRAPRAPLKEISHFSLRLEQSVPRPQGEQLWYGRTLKPRIDIPFFKDCLLACQQLHGDACSKSSWPSQSYLQEIDQKFPFRLIDVWGMRLVREDFSRIIRPAPDPNHRTYVVLSYVWGTSEWTEHRDSEGQAFYYNMITKESTYNRPGHTRLTRENMNSLLQPGSLEKDDVYIPKTIQDAIDVCKRMGQEFLWVDSLCIIQDEGDPDNAANIARMGRIYSEALFTIVAGDAPTADSGMVGITRDRVVSDQLMDTVLGDIQLFLPIGMQQSFYPWESRAWTLQEKMLSRRMLLIASGYAVWRCRGGIWREDVNALDANSNSALFPWLHLKPIPGPGDSLNGSGLHMLEEGESVRLFRLPAFCQYIKVVEDLSGRQIGEPWKILDAFEGLRGVLESPEILNSSFRYGLPTRFIDASLLWQPQGSVRRRRNQEDENCNTLRLSPPSWSWAGWEPTEVDSKGIMVGFETPFEVHADENGLLMCTNPIGEERVRPLHGSLYGITKSVSSSKGTPSHKLTDLGLLSQRKVFGKVPRDWESFQVKPKPVLPPQNLPLNNLSDRHLIFCTSAASLWLGNECFRIRTCSEFGDTEYIRENLQDEDPSQTNTNASQAYEDGAPEQDVTISRERWIIDAASSTKVGTVKLNSGAKPSTNDVCDAVTAIVLSEAQYLGNEKRVDVSGYPLYNIMVIEKRKDGFVERVGLGKIYKSAWKRAGPRQEVVVVE